MEITPKAMEIEYIRIKRFNLEREKAYATGMDNHHFSEVHDIYVKGLKSKKVNVAERFLLRWNNRVKGK